MFLAYIIETSLAELITHLISLIEGVIVCCYCYDYVCIYIVVLQLNLLIVSYYTIIFPLADEFNFGYSRFLLVGKQIAFACF